MGYGYVDNITKGLHAVVRTGKEDGELHRIDPDRMSPLLNKLLETLIEDGRKDGPTEVFIGVVGKEPKVFTFQLNDLREIKEILEWTIAK